MSQAESASLPCTADTQDPSKESARQTPIAAQYSLSIALVAVCALLAAGASSAVPAPGLTLIFVLPVVIAGAAYGLGPSLAATFAGVLAFDFFFTRPYFTLRIDNPEEIWAAMLLLATAIIVSTVAWQSRRHALEASRAAKNGEALRGVAHALIQGASQAQLVQASAYALMRIFNGPSAVLCERDGDLHVEATSEGAQLSDADLEAAKGALSGGVHMRAQMFPHDQANFDMWPIVATEKCRYVLGVNFSQTGYERPADADRLIETVSGYIVANLARTSR